MEVRHDPEARAMREAEREHRGEWADADHDTGEGAERGRGRRGTTTGGRGRRDWDEQDRSIGHIVGDLTSEVAHLARVEAQLAAREIADKAKRVRSAAACSPSRASWRSTAGPRLALAAGIALALVMPAWLAAL